MWKIWKTAFNDRNFTQHLGNMLEKIWSFFLNWIVSSNILELSHEFRFKNDIINCVFLVVYTIYLSIMNEI